MIYEISQNENIMLTAIRELKPYETVSIQKDANGKPDFFIINREQKILLTDRTNSLSTGV